MNGLDALRTAFQALVVAFALSLLLIFLRPELTEPVAALFHPSVEEPEGNSRFAGAIGTEKPAPRSADKPPHSDGVVVQSSRKVNAREDLRGSRMTVPVATVAHRSVAAESPTQRELAPAPVETAEGESMDSGKVEVENQRKLSAQLASLQSAIERLATAESARQADDAVRAVEQRQQFQQAERLRELEMQIRQLRSAAETANPPVPKPPADEPAPVAQGEQPQTISQVKRDGDRFSLSIQRAEVNEVLELLGQMTGYNIVINEGVGGTVPSLTLRDVTVVQAVDSIVRSLGLVYEQDGEFIYVMKEADQNRQRTKSARVAPQRKGAQ